MELGLPAINFFTGTKIPSYVDDSLEKDSELLALATEIDPFTGRASRADDDATATPPIPNLNTPAPEAATKDLKDSAAFGGEIDALRYYSESFGITKGVFAERFNTWKETEDGKKYIKEQNRLQDLYTQLATDPAKRSDLVQQITKLNEDQIKYLQENFLNPLSKEYGRPQSLAELRSAMDPKNNNPQLALFRGLIAEGQENGILRNEYRKEYAGVMHRYSIQLEDMRRYLENWFSSDEGKAWKNNPENAGKVPQALMNYARERGYTLDPKSPTGVEDFVRVAMDTPLDKIFDMRFQAQQLYELAKLMLEFWQEQLAADMYALQQSIKLASSTA